MCDGVYVKLLTFNKRCWFYRCLPFTYNVDIQKLNTLKERNKEVVKTKLIRSDG